MINNGVINNNLTRGNKAEIIGWGTPDYSASITITKNIDILAETDGVIYGSFRIDSNTNNRTGITINGYNVVGSVSETMGANCWFFLQVSKNDTYKISGGYSAYFAPLKGVK